MRDGDEVSTHYTPTAGYDGPPGIFHGGLQATLLDELAGWTLVGLRSRMGFTTSLRVRYIRPMRVGAEVVGRGRIIAEEPHLITVRATLEQDGRIGARAVITFAVPDLATAERTLGRALDPTWAKFCRP
jgi:acyl-coenzyme A thioesterase PaaI-like protein